MTESSPVLVIEPVEETVLGSAGCVVSNTKAKVLLTLHTLNLRSNFHRKKSPELRG